MWSLSDSVPASWIVWASEWRFCDEAPGVARGDREAADRQRPENFRFFGTPHAAIVSTDADLGLYGAVDCGAYVQNFMLAARAHGVSSIAQAVLALYPDS